MAYDPLSPFPVTLFRSVIAKVARTFSLLGDGFAISFSNDLIASMTIKFEHIESFISDSCEGSVASYCVTSYCQALSEIPQWYHDAAVCCTGKLQICHWRVERKSHLFLFDKLAQRDFESMAVIPLMAPDVICALKLEDAFGMLQHETIKYRQKEQGMMDSMNLTIYIRRGEHRFVWRADRFPEENNPVERFVNEFNARVVKEQGGMKRGRRG
ncbi:MAG TPA: hypothetical protein VG269_25585 [Tepidisphaeraceae bacterium]|jgi:hypothetical protein|nr:hypothetical protein [Tepidisphaeraceae bacterium]